MLLPVAGGAVLGGGTFMGWEVIEGVTVPAIREGRGGNGALALLLIVYGGVASLLGLVSLVRSLGGRPRFGHWMAVPGTWFLAVFVHNTFASIDDSTRVYRLTFHPHAYTGTGQGFTLVWIGLALIGTSPLLGLRQAVVTLRH